MVSSSSVSGKAEGNTTETYASRCRKSLARHPSTGLWALAFAGERIAHPNATGGGPVATLMLVLPILIGLGAVFGAGVEMVFEIKEVASNFVRRLGVAAALAIMTLLVVADNGGFDGTGRYLGFQLWAFLLLLLSFGWETVRPVWFLTDEAGESAADAPTTGNARPMQHPSGPFPRMAPGGPCMVLPLSAASQRDLTPRPNFVPTTPAGRRAQLKVDQWHHRQQVMPGRDGWWTD